MYADHKGENQDELSVTKGEIVGLVEDDSFDVYWKVYMCKSVPTKNIDCASKIYSQGRIGRVPSKCFEPPSQGKYALTRLWLAQW